MRIPVAMTTEPRYEERGMTSMKNIRKALHWLVFLIVAFFISRAVSKLVSYIENRTVEFSEGLVKESARDSAIESTNWTAKDQIIIPSSEEMINCCETESFIDEADNDQDFINKYSLYDYSGFGLTAEKPARTLLDVQEAITYLGMHAVPSPLHVFVDGIKYDELCQILDNFDTTYFSVSSCSLVEPIKSTSYAEYEYTKTPCYYVYRKIVFEEAIPETETEASEIYDVVMRFINTNISAFMSNYEKELAIHNYIATTSEFGDADVYRNSEHSAYGPLINHIGVCEGYAKAMELLSNCCGLECRMIKGIANGGLHAWNLIKLEDDWYHVDVTWDDPPKSGSEYDLDIAYTYFNLDDEYMNELFHSWKAEFYPECQSIEYNYYSITNSFTDYNGFVSMAKKNAVSGNIFAAAVYDYDSEIYSLNNVIENTGYTGRWAWSMEREIETRGFQIIHIFFF